MTDIIDEIIRREGGAKVTNDPADSGGRTQYGISERAHPEAWVDGKVTYPEARGIYEKIYILQEHFDRIPDAHLRHQLVDHGVTSGPDTSTRMLQQVLGVKVDGEIGPKTIKAVEDYPDGTLFGVSVPGKVLLNLAVRDARVLGYATVAKRWPKNLKFLLGWLRRTQEFK